MKKILSLIITLVASIHITFSQDPEPDYLCFEVEAGTKIGLRFYYKYDNTFYDIYSNRFKTDVKVMYSYDKINWKDLYGSGITPKEDCPIYLKGKNKNFGTDNGNAFVCFFATKPIYCSGNIMTLVDEIGSTTTLTDYKAFAYLFYSCPIITPPKLPATSLSQNCYDHMFSDCTEFIIAPELPALSVNSQSYSSMFSNCTKLTIPPELPATSLSLGCYSGMFTGCSSLVIPPELPATTLKEYCYNSMFSGCTSLTTTPILSASTITLGCYLRMFSGCKNIRQTAPILFVSNGGGTDITYGDCEGMFLGCENLQYISVKFESWKSRGRYNATYGQMEVQSATENWVKGVAPNGTFVCPDKLSKQFDVNHIPEGWTVKSIDDLEAYNINIPQESRKYIIIPYTTEIEAGTEMSFYVKDRTSEGLTFDGVTVVGSGQNSISLTNNNNVYTFTMPAEDVTISVTYSSTPINYTITTDDYSTVDKTEASEGETVNVTFKDRAGYNLTSATYNGTALTITNNAAQFTMPAANVTIATTHTPIEYNITAGEFVTVDKTKATINDQVSFTVADRTSNGYKLDKVLVNNTEFTGTSFNMADYLKDVTITAQYSKIGYTITTDDYSSTDKTTANVGDVVNVTFTNRGGYNLTSATYNGTPLNITNNAAQFTMPAANVTIATTHTPIEYKITAGEFVTVDKTKATINDQVSFTVADRKADGYKLDKVLVNNTEFTGTSFNMADYLKDVTITAQYSKIGYTITTDAYSSTDKTAANVGDVVNVTFTNRGGYNLTSATYNGTALTITNSAAQFTMPAANVTIATTHTPIEYKITAGEFVTVDKTKATINDQVSFTVADRTNNGYKLDKVLVNNTEFSGTSFNMADYLKDVTITAVYSKNSNPIVEYTITNDEFSTTDKASANEGDVINVTFTNRVGYILTSATYNGTELTITDGAAQFTMPAANVTIATTHTPIEYNITAGEFVTVDKTKATINDQVSFTVADRTNDGYKLDNVLVNNTEFTGRSFNMADYLKDVTITAVYSKNSNPIVEHTITNDEFSTTDKASANEGDVITVTFINRDGYNLTSATYNGSPLNITDNAAQFTMPAANVTIATTYKPIKNDKLLIVDDIIVEADGYCAGDVLRLSFKTTCKKGKYQIMFSERAKAEGFVDLDFADIEDSERQTAMFDIPSSTNYGNYQGFIRVVDADGNEGAAFPFGFNIDYPNDIIETKYADLICVNNFSHNYVAYQWMKNGKEIAGANKQFYIDYPALNGVYNVIVTDKNGNKFKVCDFRAAELKTKSAPKPSVNVYPNPAQSMQPVTIELVGVDNTEKCEIMLYTHSGSLVQKISNAKTMNVVYLKSGIYTGVVVINGKKLTFKLIVNE